MSTRWKPAPPDAVAQPPLVLTVQQPYASLIIEGQKWIENRSWATRYRGPLLIHAGVSQDSMEMAKHYAAELQSAGELRFGVILGAVTLTDCRPVAELADDPWAEGPWCWLLEGPLLKLDKPFPCAGQRGLWLAPVAFWKEHEARCDHCRRAQPVCFGATGHLCNRCGKSFPLSW